MSVLRSRSLKQTKSDGDDQGSKHADLMERRRASKQAQAPEETSKNSLRRTPSQISEKSADQSKPSTAPLPVIIVKVDPQLQLDLELVLSQISRLLQKVDSVADKVATCLDDTAAIKVQVATCLDDTAAIKDQVATCLDDTAALKVLCQPRSDALGPTLFLQALTLQVPDLADSGGDMLPGEGLTSGTRRHRPSEDYSSGHSSAGSVGSVAGSLTSKEEADEKEEEESGDGIGIFFQGGEIWIDDNRDPNQKDKDKNAGGDPSNDAAAAAGAVVMAGEPSLIAPPLPPPPGAEVPRDMRQTSHTSSQIAHTASDESRLSLGDVRGFTFELQREAGTASRRVRKRCPLGIKVWSFLEDPDSIVGGRFTRNAVSAMIIVSVVIPVVQTMDPPPLHESEVRTLDIALDVVFALEVAVRFLTCPNRIAFCLDGYSFIDIAAGALVLGLRCFSSSIFINADSISNSVLLSLVCAVPVLRLLKLLRRFDDFFLILKAFRLASEALPVLLFILSVIVLVFASLIYVLEPRSNIDSLPKALWMTVVTVGTVGYGDVVPESPWGSLVTVAMIVVSALYMAIPVGIVGKAFSDVWDDRGKLHMIHRARNRFLERGYKAQDIPAMFCSFDHDRDGELDLSEFMAMMHKMQVALGKERLTELFLSFDSDGSGGIDDAEFVRILFPSAYAQMYGIKSGTGDTTGE